MKQIIEQIRISRLLLKEVLGDLKSEEFEKLKLWKSKGNNQVLHRSIMDENEFSKRNKLVESINTETEWQFFLNSIDNNRNKVRSLNQMKWFKVAASIAAILVMGVLIYTSVYIFNVENNTITAESIHPGRAHAELVLADGAVVNLEAQTEDKIVQEGAVIANAEGVLAYNAQTTESDIVEENRLRVPRGGEYQLVLPDGSKVWLNSDSELRYPVRFTGDKRHVKLLGEAYFEVTKDVTKPFIITTDKQEIEVLGTSFNVSAYDDDEHTLTTLVEGSVKVSYGFNNNKPLEEILRPNQQLILNKVTNSTFTSEVDTYLYTAWKDGRFVFKNETLESILLTFSRWYDIEVFFENEELKKLNFSGNLERYASMSNFIKILEMEMSVDVNIEDNVLYISK